MLTATQGRNGSRGSAGDGPCSRHCHWLFWGLASSRDGTSHRLRIKYETGERFGKTVAASILCIEMGSSPISCQVIDKSVNAIIPIHSNRLETTGIKTMLMTLKYKHTVEDAALGFFRSSVHQCVTALNS